LSCKIRCTEFEGNWFITGIGVNENLLADTKDGHRNKKSRRKNFISFSILQKVSIVLVGLNNAAKLKINYD